MFCIKCGKTLDSSVDVCPDCGTKVVLPEGFDLQKENTVKVDIDMLVGEKTVAADHSALARKAFAAANADTASEPSAEGPEAVVAPVAPTAPVMKDTVPHSPADFDLKSAKKTMNGRSILIDDSPLPGTVPAYLAPAPVQAAPCATPQVQMSATPAVAQKPQGKKTLILIIAAAVLGVAIIAVLLVFFLGGDKKGNGKDNDDKEYVITAAATEKRTEAESGKSDKEDFISDKTGVNTIIGDEENTDRFLFGNENGDEYDEPLTRRPSGNKPVNPFAPDDRNEDDDKDESVLNGSFGDNVDESADSDSGEDNNVENNLQQDNNSNTDEPLEDDNINPEGASSVISLPSING